MRCTDGDTQTWANNSANGVFLCLIFSVNSLTWNSSLLPFLVSFKKVLELFIVLNPKTVIKRKRG